MSAPGIRHPVLGTDRDLNLEPLLCSFCDADITKDVAPLMIFGGIRPDGDDYAWAYCDGCSRVIFERIGPR